MKGERGGSRRRQRLAGAALLLAALVFTTPASTGAQPAFCVSDFDDVAQPCPDLTIEVEGHSFVDQATRLELTVVVRNQGSALSPETRVDGVAAGWETASEEVPPLKQDGDSARVVLTFDVPDERRGQTDAFVVTVDPDNDVTEPNDENNSDELDIAVPAPDLAAAARGRRFTDEGTRLEIAVAVTNLGNAPSAETRIEGVAPGWETASEEVPQLEQGGRAPVVLTFDIPEERRSQAERFVVTVDPDEDVVEANEDNNSFEVRVRVPAPDLAIGTPSSREVDGGERLELTVVVTNEGAVPSSEATVEAAAPGWETASEEVGKLEAGDSETVGLTFDIPEELRGQSHQFVVTVDPDDEVVETSEENNSLDTPIRVTTLVGPQDDGGFPTAVVIAAVAALLALGAAAIVARNVRRGRMAGRLPPPEGAPAEPPAPSAERRAPRTARPPPEARLPERRPPAPERPLPSEQRVGGAAPTEPLSPPPAHERVVSTGFAPQAAGQAPIDPNSTLASGEAYYFWLEVGPAVAESIEARPVDLPTDVLPPEARLTVALYAIENGVQLSKTADIGQLRLQPDGRVLVERQPTEALGLPPESELRFRRLFFPLRTPQREGAVQFRCNIYYEQVLVQSRLIRAHVTRVTRPLDGALTSVVDYTLAPRLDAGLLAGLPRHRLSVLLNKNGDGTHGLSFFGEQAFKSNASFDGDELQDLIRQARGALRRSAWGDEEPWEEGRVYLYEQPAEGQFETDLIRFAIRGFRFYAAVIDRLAGDPDAADALARLMEKPGLIQIASKESPRHVIPASLIYDYVGFDTTARFADYELCPAFLDALEDDAPLEELRCFQGDCPSRGAETVVCPSGFWGYRHSLGMPVSVAEAPDASAEILYGEGPSLVVAVSTDPDFKLRAAHEQALRALREGLVWSYADTRAEAVRLMKETKAEVVYFYCHGGVEGDVPFIQVGPLDERGITADFILSQRIRWDSPRPLVFINGCRTTALEPEKALEFVSILIRRAQASGVIGTEITIFEPLARVFAEECLRRFFDGAAIGDAVRGARLSLLKAGNPLGLAYIPFVLAGLRIVRRPAAERGVPAEEPVARLGTPGS
jgi:hypothetical protein